MTRLGAPQADITVGVIDGMLLIDRADNSLRQSLEDVLRARFAYMIPVDEAWAYLEPLLDAGLTIEQVEP